jgi:putative acetyltransferase
MKHDPLSSARIEIDDLSRPAVRALVAQHLAEMHATSPPESVHALDLSGLSDPRVTMWTLWEGDDVLGCAALAELTACHGEIKSMRTDATARHRGVATRLLSTVIGEARRRGYRQLSLETGTQPFFEAAHRLYERYGFVPCGPFGDYLPDPNSRYFTLALE